MERRLVIFLVASFAFLLVYYRLFPPHKPPAPEPPVAAEKAKQPAGKETEKPAAANKPKAEEPIAEAEKAAPAVQQAPEPKEPQQWIMLGSVDENDPYRMLVTLTNKGAAVERIELSSLRYCDIDDRSGYLGHLVMDPAANGKICRVQIVGAGTPAAKAGIKPGDVIKSIDGKEVTDAESLDEIMSNTKPKKRVEIVVSRDGKDELLKATLRRRPLEVIRPEGDDPLSMLLTLQRFDDKRLGSVDEKADKDKTDKEKAADPQKVERLHEESIRRELDGVNLRTANWTIVPSGKPDEVQFQRVLPVQGLEITKTYRLVKVPEEFQRDSDFPAYHLEFEIAIRNIGDAAHKVAYRLDGPNGLPTEGSWYAYKVSRNWGGAGLRDFVISFGGRTPGMVGAATIANGKADTWPDDALTFVGVDAQYFSAVLLPERVDPSEVWFDQLAPIRVGRVDPNHLNLTNTSCRLTGALKELKPGEVLINKFKFFAGPKKPSVLKPYALGELVYFGWPVFAMVAVPLTVVLHGFYAVVQNYGLAIILLTVLVRGCMFPLSRKQALGAEDGAPATGDQEAPGEIQEQRRRAHKGPAGVVPQAQLQPIERLSADLHPDAGVHRAVPVAHGGDRTPRRPADFQLDPLVLEPCRAGHALRLEQVHAGVRQ